MIILTLIFSTCVHSNQHQEEANSRANAGALKAIKYIPRYGGDSTMDTDDFNWNDDDFDNQYWVGIAFCSAIPLIFAGLSVLICPLWTLCRCCKCCCCKKKRPRKEVTICSIYGPYILVFSSVVAVVAMVAIAYGANVDFSGALLYNEGEGEQSNLYDVAETLITNSVDKAVLIEEITEDLRSGIISAIEGVQSFLDDTSILSVGSSSLISMLSSISVMWSNHSIDTDHEIKATCVMDASGNEVCDTYTFECTFCASFGSEVALISDQIETQIGPIFADLNLTVNEIDSSLISIEADIIAQVDLFIEQISETRGDLSEYEGEVEDSRSMVQTHNDHRETAYNVIFAIPLIAIVFILFGGILKKPLCFTLSYMCLWFTCTLMWVLLAVHLPIAVLLNDACSFMDVAEQDGYSTVFPQTTNGSNVSVGEIFDACLNDTALADALGLSQFLDFSHQIEFPLLGNITQDFQFTELVAFEDDAFATDKTTFYSTGDTALLHINNLTDNSPMADPAQNGGSDALIVHWDRMNVASLDSKSYYPMNSSAYNYLEELKGVMVAESASITAFSETVQHIQQDLSAVSAQAASIEMDVQELVTNVDNSSQLLKPLFVSVDEMENAARCGFVGDAYRDTKAVMCSAVLGSLSRIVGSMMVIAFLSLFACLWSVKLVRRVEWWQTQKREEKEDKLQQSFQPNKPKIIVMQQQMQQQAQHGYQPGGGNGRNMPQAQGMYYNSQHL